MTSSIPAVRRVRVRAKFAGFLAMVLTLPVLLASPAHAASRVVTPRTPAGLPAAIESLGNYTEQVSCDPKIRPGTRKLATLLASTYKSHGASSWASTYACATDGTRSEHYDGRAIDWMVDIHDRSQYAAARATIKWLLATDSRGNRDAMARRLGVMYLIYDNRIWGGWDGQWEPYNNCAHLTSHAYDNACHRTHIHISLTWNGAMGRTSYWTKKVFPTDYGPCRPRDLNWGPAYRHANPRPCPDYPQVVAARGASAIKRGLVTYSGARVHRHSTGPVVTAVQQALHVRASGVFGTATVSRVRALQRRHHLSHTGVLNQATWRVLLAITH